MAKWLIESRTARLLAFAGSTLMFGVIFLAVAALFENPTGWLLSQQWPIMLVALVAFPWLLIGTIWRHQFDEDAPVPTWLTIIYLAVMSWFLAGLILLLSSIGVRLLASEPVRLLGTAATFALVTWIAARTAVGMAAVTWQHFTPRAPRSASRSSPPPPGRSPG